MTNSIPGYDAPIFVTGMPRSGTTFVQHLLSSHPRICIHGQEPKEAAWGDWLNKLVEGVAFAKESNQELGYEQPHYAGASANVAATESEFLATVFRYMSGGSFSPRWGLKSLTQCRIAADKIVRHFPNARWIVCIREPFRSIESLRNTYDTEQIVSVETLIDWWTDAARFAAEWKQAMPVQVDRLIELEDRASFVRQLFSFIGEPPVEAVWEFTSNWPTIHEVVTQGDRAYQFTPQAKIDLLNSHDHFRYWANALGYEIHT